MMIEDNGVKFEDNISRNQNLTFLKQWDGKLHLSALRASEIRKRA